jgi:hypothetical protein
MRNKPPFTCPQCGDTGLGGNKCLRCKVEMVDQAGVPELAPSAVFLGHPTFDGFTHPWAKWVSAVAFIITFSATIGGDVPWYAVVLGVQAAVWLAIVGAYLFVKKSRVKNHKNRLGAVYGRITAAPKAAPVGSASGACHVRGRVRVVKPVKSPLGAPVAAYLERRKRETVEVLPAGRGQTRRAVTAITVEESSAVGMFLVEDESGAALIDDDAITVVQVGGTAEGWDSPLSIVVKDGDEIEIIGPAERKPGSAYPELAKEGGYREAASLLVFDGKPAERILVLAKSTGILMNA